MARKAIRLEGTTEGNRVAKKVVKKARLMLRKIKSLNEKDI